MDAGRLDNDFTTVSGALWWMPTTGEFGTRGSFGDYDWHEDVATRLGAHFTFSPEDKQSQPGTDDPDNTQIRLSNGTVVFTPGALGADVDQIACLSDHKILLHDSARRQRKAIDPTSANTK